MKTIYLLLGTKFSGKEEFMRSISPGEFTYIDIENIRREKGTNHGIFKTMLKEFRRALKDTNIQSNIIYINGPFHTRHARFQLLRICKQYQIPCDVIIIYFNTPLEVLLQRNKESENPLPEAEIRKQHFAIQYPFEIDNSKIEIITPKPNKEVDNNDILVNRGSNDEPIHSNSMGNSNNTISDKFSILGKLSIPAEEINPHLEFLLRVRAALQPRPRGSIFSWGKRKIKE